RSAISLTSVNFIDVDLFDPSQVGISSHMDYKGNVSETWRGIANMSLDLGGGLSLASVTGINKVDSTIQFDFDTKRDNVPSLTPVGGGLYICLPGVCVGIAEFDTRPQLLSQELRLCYV